MIIDSNLYNSDAESRAWLISKINRISPDGIVRVTLAQDTYDQHNDYIERDTDGKVIGKWANYYDNAVEPIPMEIDDEQSIPDDSVDPNAIYVSSITCSGLRQFKVGGSAKTFTITFKNKYGEEIDPEPISDWSIIIGDNSQPIEGWNFVDGNNSYPIDGWSFFVTTDSTVQLVGNWSFYIGENQIPNNLLILTPVAKNKIKVKFLGDDSYIGKILTVKCVSGDATASLDIEIIAL